MASFALPVCAAATGDAGPDTASGASAGGAAGENVGGGSGGEGISLVDPIGAGGVWLATGGGGSTSGAVVTCGAKGAGAPAAATGGAGAIGGGVLTTLCAGVAAGPGALDNAGAHAAIATHHAATTAFRMSCQACAACDIVIGILNVTGSANDRDSADVEATGVPVFRAHGGSLYVVATPLGNLRDITLRALDILRSADVIAAEDTRVSATLLRHYGIAARMIALHEHNEARRAPLLIEHLAAGRSVALVSDAGTPAISDPGARVVAAARAAGFAVVPIPGPNAAIAAISAAGLSAERFVFVGFLHGNARQRHATFALLQSLPYAIVLYEAPHRVRATVLELVNAFGGERRLVIGREITKRFETIVAIALGDAPAWLDADDNRLRGEFVLVVDAPAAASPVSMLDASSERWLSALLEQMSPAQAARIAAAATGVAREVVYARALAIKGGAA